MRVEKSLQRRCAEYGIRWIWMLCAFFWFADGSAAQQPAQTPRQCVNNHLHYLQPDSYRPEWAALSFYGVDSSRRVELAIKLKRVWDGMGMYVPVHRIPNDSNYRDTSSGRSVYVIFPVRMPQVYVEKIGRYWYYSPESYNYIEEAYSELYPFGAEVLRRLFSGFGEQRILGLAVWQYLGMASMLLLSWVLYFILKAIFRRLVIYLAHKGFRSEVDFPRRFRKAARVLSLLTLVLLNRYGVALLLLPIGLSSVLITLLELAKILLIALLLYRLLDIVFAYVQRLASRTESKMDDQALPLIRQLSVVVIVIGALIQVLVLFEVNLTAIIAGISIGGLALALAAQDTVKNFIGSLMIFADRPFQIGDWIEIDDKAGVVEEVGFRSTRIKQKDTSIISIPNALISQKTLVNKGVRVYRLFETTIGLTYDTPRHYLDAYIQGLRAMVRAHPKLAEHYYIYLHQLGAYSIDIFFRVYLRAADYEEELRIREEIIFLMMRLAEAVGVRFAFPSQTIYVEQFPGHGDLLPSYGEDEEQLREKVRRFVAQMQNQSGGEAV